MTDTTDGGKQIKSAGTVFDILEVLATRDEAGVSEIARELDYSKSTIHYYLKTLERRRYVLNESGTYRLGLRLANLGSNAAQRHELAGHVEDQAAELADETGAVVHVAVEQGGKAVFLHRAAAVDAPQIDTRVGMETNMHCTAYGKAILAHFSAEAIDDIVTDRGLPKKTPYTITDRAELDDELADIRTLGVAFAGEEYRKGESSIAAPIRPDGSGVRGAIGITGPAEMVSDPSKHAKARRFSGEVSELIHRTARIIGENLSDD